MTPEILQIIYITIPSVIVLLGLLYVARHYHVQAYWARYEQAKKSLSASLQAVQPAYVRLHGDPHKLRYDQTKFAGFSAEQHAIASQLWTAWLNHHRDACDRITQSSEAEKEISRRYLGFQNLKLLKSTIAVLLAGDPADTPHDKAGCTLLSSSAPALAQLQRFEDAIAVNKAKMDRFKRENDALGILLVEAENLEVCHSSIKANHDKIERLCLELEQKLLLDPLDGQDAASRYLQSKQLELSNALKQALRQAEIRAKLNVRDDFLRKRVEKLQLMPLKSSLAEIRAFTAGHSFDEPGFVLQDKLDECTRQKDAMQDALNKRRGLLFSRAQVALQQELSVAEQLLEKVLADKALCDTIIETVYADATAADIAADSAQRAKIATAYQAQRFNEASLAAEILRDEHALRCQSRESIGKIAQPLEAVVQLLHSYKDVVSSALDQKFQLLVIEVSELEAKAKQGKADWPALVETAARLTERLIGQSGSESIMQLARAEIASHAMAKEAIAKLKEQMAFLDQHLAWAELAESSSRQMAEATSVVAASALRKQDWNKLIARTQAADSALAVVRAAVDELLAVHATQRQTLVQFETQLSKCGAELAYEREICGKKFGSALYCQVAEAGAQLEKLNSLLSHRNYDALARELSQARGMLFRENLETWWACLQQMAASSLPCARRFAAIEGYTAGAFKRWSDEKLHICGNDLYEPAAAAACSSHKETQSYPAALRAADPPRSSDYKPASPKALDTSSSAT